MLRLGVRFWTNSWGLWIAKGLVRPPASGSNHFEPLPPWSNAGNFPRQEICVRFPVTGAAFVIT